MLVEKEETESTNDDARALALAGAPHGAAVLAARQRAGRGRDQRGFVSPEGGLYLSVVLRPRAPVDSWSILPLLAGAATVSALRPLGTPAELKWPNDVVLGAKKLGGILVESRLDARPFAVVGIGLNVLAAPEGVPNATALAMQARAPDVRALAESVRAALVARVARLDAGGVPAVLPEVRALCGTLGRRVTWEDREGLAIDIDEDGALLVKAEGRVSRVVAGDVRVRFVAQRDLALSRRRS